MSRVLTIVRNDAGVPAGHVERVATALGVAVETVALEAGDSLPDPDDVDAAVVLGGEMGAYDVERAPYLADEKAFLRDLVDRGVPVLGLCLGCQLLADALGGSAYLADRPEVAFAPMIELQPDPVVSVLAERSSLAMHRDTWDLPPGATLIARTVAYNGAFRLGSALGVQPHPEVDEAAATKWLTDPGGVALAEAAGANPSTVLSEYRAALDEVADTADRMFGAWLIEAGLIGRRHTVR